MKLEPKNHHKFECARVQGNPRTPNSLRKKKRKGVISIIYNS